MHFVRIKQNLGDMVDVYPRFHFREPNECFNRLSIADQFAKVVNATPYALNFELVYGMSTVTLRVSSLPALYVAKDGVCGGTTPCYSLIQAAINAASDGSLIKIAQGTYNESFVLNQARSLILQGGWNSAYTTQTANTTFMKAPKAPQGSLKLQMVTIRP